jgi:acyl-CoA hydrolase/GNAT superfamily N-acetyltransferase
MNLREKFSAKIVSPEQAASQVRNGDRIFLGSMCAEPGIIVDALSVSRVEDVEIIQFMTGRSAAQLAAKGRDRFRIKTFFLGGLGGDTQEAAEADYVPLFHSQIPFFLRNRRIPIDIAIVQVSEPDRFGRFSLGTSVDVSLSAVESARMVIAQVNRNMPRTQGDTLIQGDRIAYFVEHDEELFELPGETLGDKEKKITKYCSELIEDGSIVQFGFAGISKGLMDYLKDRKDLGIHTEIFTDALMDLMEAGIINNSTKKMYRGKCLATTCMGTKRLYEFVHENSVVELYPSDFVLNPTFIAQNDRMISINLALQVDLKGQIRQGKPTWTAFESSGGDHDFMRGATLSQGGRSAICLRSTSLTSGRSTIVPSFGPKSSVIMNRGEVNYVVTEYGIAYLGGKSIREKAMALVEIAHPDHRENLMREARELGYVYPNQVYCCMASPALRERVRTDREFRGGIKAHIRVAKPTDESMMRDLFYHLSESSVYFRYFSPKRSMPLANLQKYLNISEGEGLSIVVTTGPRENRRMIAEARYMLIQGSDSADTAFMVDEYYQGKGIATFLLHYLIEIARERNVGGFRADVLLDNQPMLRVYESVPYVIHKTIDSGVVELRFRFDELKMTGEEVTT